MANAVLQPHLVHQLLSSYDTFFLFDPRKTQGKGYIRFRAHIGDQVETLEDEPDLIPAVICQRVLVHGADCLPIHMDFTRSWPVQSAHQIQQRAFAGTTGTHDHSERTGRNVQVQPIQGVHFRLTHVIGFAQVDCLNKVIRHRRFL